MNSLVGLAKEHQVSGSSKLCVALQACPNKTLWTMNANPSALARRFCFEGSCVMPQAMPVYTVQGFSTVSRHQRNCTYHNCQAWHGLKLPGIIMQRRTLLRVAQANYMSIGIQCTLEGFVSGLYSTIYETVLPVAEKTYLFKKLYIANHNKEP